MLTLAAIKTALREGPHSFPSGYPKFFVAPCGVALSFKTVRAHWRDVCEAHIVKGCRNNGWALMDCCINWEDAELYCHETGERIESAYVDD